MARRDLTPTTSQVDQLEPTGWPNRTSTTLAYTSATRTVTLTVGGSGASFYGGGQRYTLAASAVLTVVHANTTGIHFIYFDQSTTLQSSTTPWTIDSTQTPVAAVYYSTTMAAGVALEERHGIQMDGNTHRYLHFTEGTKVLSGFGASGYTLNPAVPVNTDIDFDIATGLISDEDLESTVPTLTAGASAYRVWYRTGAAGEWVWDTTTYPFTVGASYMQYNQWTGATWQKTELANNRYVNMWVMTTPAITTGHGIIQVMGQVSHATLADAQEEAFNSLQFGTLPFTEFAALYRVTFRTSVTYATTGKVRIESFTRIVGTTVTIAQTSIGSHGALSGLADPNQHPATSVSTDTTNFAGRLTAADDTVQKALDTLDDVVAPLASPTFTGTVTVPGLTSTTATSRVTLGTDAGGSISIGRIDSVASTPYIDFNSGATTTDYDARIQASGGTGVAGGGTLTIAGGTVALSGTVTATSTIQANSGYFIGGNAHYLYSDADSIIMRITSDGPYVAFSDKAGVPLIDGAGGTLALGVADTEYARLTSVGLGIGVTPSKKLHVGPQAAAVSATNLALEGSVGGYGAGISFQSQLTGGALAEMARITADGESSWNTTASTQDAGLRFFTTRDGVAAERVRVNSAGEVGIGTTTPDAALEVEGGRDALLQLTSSWANSAGASLYLHHTRGTGGAHGIVSNNDSMGIRFRASDGTAYRSMALISADVDGTPGASDMPGRLVFSTTPDGSATVVERMRINNAGNVGIGVSTINTLLEVGGTIRTSRTGTPAQYIDIFSTGGLGVIRASSGTPLELGVNATHMRIDTSGRVSIGGPGSVAGGYGAVGILQLSMTAGDGFQMFRGGADVNAFTEAFHKSRNATPTSHTIVASGDNVGQTVYFASDGVGWIPAALIRASVDGTPGVNDMPGRLSFHTTADGAASPSERMRITQAGRVGIATGTPGAHFEVAGDVWLGSSNGAVSGAFSVQARSQANWNYANLSLIRNAANTATPRFIGMALDGDDLASTTIGAYPSIWGVYSGSPTAGSTSSALAAEMVFGAHTGFRWYTNGTERMRIDSAGNVGIGRTPTATLDVNGAVKIDGDSATLTIDSTIDSATFSRYTATANGPIVFFGKSRNAARGGHTVVQSGDTLGGLIFRGSDGSTFAEAARIIAASDGTPGASDMPGRIVFSTTPDGSATVSERMRITSAGYVGIGTSSPSTALHVVGAVSATGTLTSGVHIINRQDASFEGGEIGLQRAVDNARGFTIDVYGNTTTPDLRFFDTTGTKVWYFSTAGNTTLPGTVSATGLAGSLLSSATPLVESGAGTPGTSTIPSRQDHVHPSAGAATALMDYSMTFMLMGA